MLTKGNFRARRRRVRCLLLALASLTDAGVAMAEDAGQTGSALDGQITVTARKRVESLQETPIAITAFNDRSMEARGIRSTEGLANLTPNLTLQNNPSYSGASNSASIYIRGIGQQDFVPTVEPGVGVYVDGVYVARSVGAILDLVDMDRIEVLRGPQGTLFGRNTIGGAISVTSKAPDFTRLAASASATYGTDDLAVVKGMVNLPVSDKIALRVSAAYFGQNGYVKRISDGQMLGNQNRFAGRMSARIKPLSDWTVDLSVDGTHARENGPPMSLIGINYGKTTDPATPPMTDIWNTIANVQAGGTASPCATASAPLNLGVANCYDNRYVLGRNTNAGTAPSYSNSDIFGMAMTHTIELSPALTIKSITAFRELTGDFARDGDDSPAAIAQFYDHIHQQQFSQELQVLGKAFGGRLDWILGAYYFKETGVDINDLTFTISRFRSGGYFRNESLAFFGQGTFKITDKLKLTAGLRYTRDTKWFHPDQYIIANLASFLGAPFNSPIFDAGTRVLPDVTARERFSEPTPMVNLAWQADRTAMIYATWSRGFKSGGFSQRVFPPIIPGVTTTITDPAAAIPSFAPEKVDVYEAGVKFQTLDRRLTVNVAGYYTDYKDMQVQVFTSVAPVFRNAGSASIKGFELEGQLRPIHGLLVEGTLGLTSAHYKQIDQATTYINPSNMFERVSKWTASAGVTYEWELPGGSMLRPHADWSYRSKFYNNTFNTPQIAQAGYSLFNAAIGWTSAGEKFGLSANIKNIGDKRFLLSGILVDALQAYEGVYNRGREWSVTASVKF
ncbi:TonB-dependent receptor domain protein [Novosphingobium nitrogenifigens DSM 19370]|uniref:TonB-dependent receptor domain protein n=1 Tax=Novosphingobium nitrogenifigens DSM 19370 TaxID=983920 RepID=F1Z3B2_9SPHN|nr:TonB-dependent receptor [Novosphingobium nitrogenifigens]EGD60901.1 TonB-dependent receptor domain protein [Novosphingobium nitrogenifigens DSM 19370]